MSDLTTPLVLSIVSLGATIVTTLIGAYITYYSDERKARRDANKILLKYRDPLLLAAADLQARCYGICDPFQDLLSFKDKDVDGETLYRDTLYIYTAYVVGQYLSWTWILRRQAQFVALVSSSPPRWNLFNRRSTSTHSSLVHKLNDIRSAFNHDDNEKEQAFMLFKADQQAIGEIMSCQDKNGEYYCMGYATFADRWKNGAPDNVHPDTKEHMANTVKDDDHIGERMAGISKVSDQAFRAHFRAIEDGLTYMHKQRAEYKRQHPKVKESSNMGSDGRLRRLQHLLLDLMTHLDTSNAVQGGNEKSPIRPAAPNCDCSLHPCHCKSSCPACVRNKRFALTIFGTPKKCPCADDTCHTPCECRHCVPSLLAHKERSSRSSEQDVTLGASERPNGNDRRSGEIV